MKTINALIFCAAICTAGTSLAQNTTATDQLRDTPCLRQLASQDEVIVSVAFHNGTGGFGQLKELIERQPWGTADVNLQTQLDKLVDELSPFLIVKINKKQALALDDHRDLIKWILVQSTDKACE